MLGINPLEYFIGAPGRTWTQFLEYFDQLCQEQGTKCWARAATDPDMRAYIDEMPPEELEKLTDDGSEEPHYGYTPLVAELRNVSDQLISLRAQMGSAPQHSVSYMPRPFMWGDLIAARKSELGREDLARTIAEAHANWEREQESGWEVL